MTKDLENTLEELGPEYGRLVDCLRAPFEERPQPRRLRLPAYLVAASFAAAVALVAVFDDSGSRANSPVTYPRCYTVALNADSVAIREMLATQRPDGGWESDFITCQNAAALRGVRGAELAYRKAVRYLRAKGLSPLSSEELKSRSRQVSAQFAAI